jgi:hypothetical protein
MDEEEDIALIVALHKNKRPKHGGSLTATMTSVGTRIWKHHNLVWQELNLQKKIKLANQCPGELNLKPYSSASCTFHNFLFQEKCELLA